MRAQIRAEPAPAAARSAPPPTVGRRCRRRPAAGAAAAGGLGPIRTRRGWVPVRHGPPAGRGWRFRRCGIVTRACEPLRPGPPLAVRRLQVPPAGASCWSTRANRLSLAVRASSGLGRLSHSVPVRGRARRRRWQAPPARRPANLNSGRYRPSRLALGGSANGMIVWARSRRGRVGLSNRLRAQPSEYARPAVRWSGGDSSLSTGKAIKFHTID